MNPQTNRPIQTNGAPNQAPSHPMPPVGMPPQVAAMSGPNISPAQVGQQVQAVYDRNQPLSSSQVSYSRPLPTNPAQIQQLQQYSAGQNPPQTIATNPSEITPPVADSPTSTQSTLLISELRDGLVIMKDGSFRAVVACQSINFDLMSSVEREGVEYSYQSFLNSLNFTIQILIRSQRVDIAPDIDRLAKLRRDNENMLLGVLMDDYLTFIEELSREANIMDKSFFIVIPYYTSADAEKLLEQGKNFFKTFTNSKNPEVTRISRDDYNKAIDVMNSRVETVISGLYSIGIQSVRLNTRELSELYYNFNNPDTAVREPLVDFSRLATMYVRKGEK